ncbi:hypothetical protein [Actinoplanes sp. N902-109]|uniref:hypothetical protein n=1 Tax=Actinoplanes sp. (strain N902-109) TaxID=649831 RepID=UPI0003294E70|nr:hypothetical protein [Actinoplanes sp. N902-109]AGL19131.1 hypothetical protein L083_5621 [Actinoplanes sp. N902-109]
MPARERLRGFATHEWTLACAGSLVLAVAMIWLLPPMVLGVTSAGTVHAGFADPVHTIIGDGADPAGQAWLLAWGGHAILHHPARLWDTNAFFPDRSGLAFNDSLLGYAPAGLAGTGVDAAVLRYNIVFVLAFALATLGAYALARQLGANRVGAAVAGVTFAYAPWRYGHEGHLNILSTGGIALALAMLARGHGWSLRRGYRADRVRPGWAAAGWLVAAWQITLGFGIGLPFFYVLTGACLAAGIGWLATGRPGIARRLLLADLLGGLAFALTSGAMAYAYDKVRTAHPEMLRTLDYVALFSPPPRGFAVAPHSSLLWGDWHEAARTALGGMPQEKTLFCGYGLYALAACGLLASVWTVRQRIWLGAGILIGVLLSLGTNGPLFRLLFEHLPGFDSSRTPGRLIVWPTLLLGILAAGFITHLAQRVRAATVAGARVAAVRLVTVPLLVLVLIEGLPAMDHVAVPAAPAALAAAPGPVMVLPSDDSIDLSIMLWSTAGFPSMANGASSIVTPVRQELRTLMQQFPSTASVTRLRALGIRSVVVLRDRVGGTPYQYALDGPVDGLGVTRRPIGADLLFTLDPDPAAAPGAPPR